MTLTLALKVVPNVAKCLDPFSGVTFMIGGMLK